MHLLAKRLHFRGDGLGFLKKRVLCRQCLLLTCQVSFCLHIYSLWGYHDKDSWLILNITTKTSFSRKMKWIFSFDRFTVAPDTFRRGEYQYTVYANKENSNSRYFHRWYACAGGKETKFGWLVSESKSGVTFEWLAPSDGETGWSGPMQHE
jgi:hypothetical protein